MVASTRSILQNEGLWHAQTLLEEIIAGCRPEVLDQPQKIDSDSDWYFRLKRRADDVLQVEDFEVTVWKSGRWRAASEVTLDRMVFRGGNR
jgi:hypothetical protein